MKKIDLTNFPNCSFGKKVIIEAENLTIEDGVRIDDNVFIQAKDIQIGYDSVIEKNTVIKGLGQEMTDFIIGDNTFIGFNNQILVPEFSMLDYSQLHNSCLNTGYKPLKIGYNCWIGQNTILNSTEILTICNNVRIGTQSQLWTHVASGELLEGCTLWGCKPILLEDNVWIVGGAVISPGLKLGKNSIIMTGSVLTKNTEPFNTYAGVPAKNVTEKLNFWKGMSLDDKFQLMGKFMNEFIDIHEEYNGRILLLEKILDNNLTKEKDLIFIVKDINNIEEYQSSNCSIFDLKSKRYIKKRSKIEIDWIKYNLGYRARFIPL